jgi:hypothetical protein
MKSKKLWLLLAVAALALLAVSPALAVPTTPTLTVSLSDSSVCAGVQVTITGNINPVITCGAFSIQESTDGGVTYFTIYSATPDASGNISTPFDTTGLAGQTIYFRSHFDPGGGTNHCTGGTYSGANSAGLPLTINDCPSCTGVTIGADLASGDGTPAPGAHECWTFRITVKACDDVTNVSAQGGTSGWTTLATGTPLFTDTGNVSHKKAGRSSTEIITWQIGNMSANQTVTLDVQVCGDIKKSAVCDSIQYLSGPWSVTYNDENGITHKSDYSGRVTVTVTCAP